MSYEPRWAVTETVISAAADDHVEFCVMDAQALEAEAAGQTFPPGDGSDWVSPRWWRDVAVRQQTDVLAAALSDLAKWAAWERQRHGCARMITGPTSELRPPQYHGSCSAEWAEVRTVAPSLFVIAPLGRKREWLKIIAEVLRQSTEAMVTR